MAQFNKRKPRPIQRVYDINILIGGAAGQGIQTLGSLLCRILHCGGQYIFGLQDYQSRIRGGHNIFSIRISNKPLHAPKIPVDILVVLDVETYRRHLPDVPPGGIILYDAGRVRPSEKLKGRAGIPMAQLSEKSAGDKKFINTVALGAVCGIIGYDRAILDEVLIETFGKKGEDILKKNIAAARAGYDHAFEHYARAYGFGLEIDGRFQKKRQTLKRVKVPRTGSRMLINGTGAGGFGMLAAGVKFYAAYPMTPSTGLLNYLAGKAERYGILVEQAEDEIAAVQMVLGASYAGARSAVGTSGGGFALMVESISHAGIAEIPVVIFLVQRPGPATGMPTRTEQGDLGFAIHAGHGEFPRFVFAPGDPEEMFMITLRAFNLADRYQVPVIILSDQYLADSLRTVELPDLKFVTVERDFLPASRFSEEYARYRLTSSGISPRAVPGKGRGVVVVDSDEHDEAGHLTEDLSVRTAQVDKRMRKIGGMRSEIRGPFVYGEPAARLRLVCWGSTLGIIREVVDRLTRSKSISLVHFSSVWPFPAEETIQALDGADRLIIVENNSQGQLSRLIRAETGIDITEKILKYNGMQFFPEEVIKQINGHH